MQRCRHNLLLSLSSIWIHMGGHFTGFVGKFHALLTRSLRVFPTPRLKFPVMTCTICDQFPSREPGLQPTKGNELVQRPVLIIFKHDNMTCFNTCTSLSFTVNAFESGMNLLLATSNRNTCTRAYATMFPELTPASERFCLRETSCHASLRP